MNEAKLLYYWDFNRHFAIFSRSIISFKNSSFCHLHSPSDDKVQTCFHHFLIECHSKEFNADQNRHRLDIGLAQLNELWVIYKKYFSTGN